MPNIWRSGRCQRHLQQSADSDGQRSQPWTNSKFRAVVDVDTGLAKPCLRFAREEHPDVLTGRRPTSARVRPCSFVFLETDHNGSAWVDGKWTTCTFPRGDCARRCIVRAERRLVDTRYWSRLTRSSKAAHCATFTFAIQVAIVETLGPERHTGHGDQPQCGRGRGCMGLLARLASKRRACDKRRNPLPWPRGLGGMAALAAASPATTIASTLNEGECRGVGIAAFNSSPIRGHHCRAYEQLDRSCGSREHAAGPFRRLPIDYPYHKCTPRKVKDPLLGLAWLEVPDSRFPFFSTVSGALKHPVGPWGLPTGGRTSVSPLQCRRQCPPPLL